VHSNNQAHGLQSGKRRQVYLRADEKGNAIEDLRKAIWYLEDEIAKRGNFALGEKLYGIWDTSVSNGHVKVKYP